MFRSSPLEQSWYRKSLPIRLLIYNNSLLTHTGYDPNLVISPRLARLKTTLRLVSLQLVQPEVSLELDDLSQLKKPREGLSDDHCALIL